MLVSSTCYQSREAAIPATRAAKAAILATRAAKRRYLLPEPRSGDTCYQSRRRRRYLLLEPPKAAIPATRAAKRRYLLPEPPKAAIPATNYLIFPYFLMLLQKTFLLACASLLFLFSACEPTVQTASLTERIEKTRNAPLRTEGSNVPIINTANETTVRELFAKFPLEQLQGIGFRTISKKMRAELDEIGQAVPFLMTVDKHTMQLREQYQQEDDEAETRDVANFAFFTRKDSKEYTVFVEELSASRQALNKEKILSQRFFRFDGKNWTEITNTTRLPQINMLFEQVLADASVQNISKTANNIIFALKPSLERADLIEVSINDNANLPGEVPIFDIKMIWNGEKFLIHQSNQLTAAN